MTEPKPSETIEGLSTCPSASGFLPLTLLSESPLPGSFLSGFSRQPGPILIADLRVQLEAGLQDVVSGRVCYRGGVCSSRLRASSRLKGPWLM